MRMLADYNGRVCFVPLAPLTDPENILPAAAHALGLAERIRRLFSSRFSRRFPPSALLVMDNWEHLLPQGAETLHRLLEAVPTLTCLTTLRQRLNLPGEYEYAVRLLETPSRDLEVDRLESCPSVQVWLDRARTTYPNFRMTHVNTGAVAALCHTLEGVPLALELTAAGRGRRHRSRWRRG